MRLAAVHEGMSSLHTRSLAVVIVVATQLAFATPARALVGTPQQCDATVGAKYYCSTVQYEPGSPATNVARYYAGQIGGSNTLVRWQLWWMQDRRCTPYPSCSWLRNYGEQAWQTNHSWVWWVINANPTMDQDALVNMKLRFHERDPMFGTDRYWCSRQLDHALWSANSWQLGDNSC
jgi:hypothetical protein